MLYLRVFRTYTSFMEQEEDREYIRNFASIRGKDKIFSIKGTVGRRIDVYPFKVVITTDATVGGFITNNAIDGIKTICFSDIIGIQLKKPGAIIGYLQFETSSGLINNEKSHLFAENTFTFDAMTPEIEQMYQVIIEKLDEYKSRIFYGE